MAEAGRGGGGACAGVCDSDSDFNGNTIDNSVANRIQELVNHYHSLYAAEKSILDLTKSAPKVDGHLRAMIADEQRYTCALCCSMFVGGYHIDHRRPQCQGGDSSRGNLWALCTNCHSRKTALENSRRLRAERQNLEVVQALQQHLHAIRSKTRMYPRGTSLCTACGVLHVSSFAHMCSTPRNGWTSSFTLTGSSRSRSPGARQPQRVGPAEKRRAHEAHEVACHYSECTHEDAEPQRMSDNGVVDIAVNVDWDAPYMF